MLAIVLLCCNGLLQLLGRDPAFSDQQVSQPVPPVDDRGKRDLTLVEVNRPEVVPIGQRKTSGSAAQVEQLDDVRKTGLLEASLDGHQRHSSTMRSPTSGQSHTTFSRLRAPLAGATMPLVR